MKTVSYQVQVRRDGMWWGIAHPVNEEKGKAALRRARRENGFAEVRLIRIVETTTATPVKEESC